MNLKNLKELYFAHCESYFSNTFSEDMYELSLLSQLNSWAIQYLPLIRFNGALHPFSMSTLMFANSGSGKDQSINFLDPIHKEVEEVVNTVYKTRYDKLHFELNKEDNDMASGIITASKFSDKVKNELKRDFDSFATDITFFSKNATSEGLNSYYKAYSILGIGSIGICSAEFSDYYQEKDFRKLLSTVLEFWNDINPSSLKVTASRNADKAKGIQSSIRLHSSFAKMKRTPDLLEDLQVFMSTALGRRTLFFFLKQDDYDKTQLAKIKYKKQKVKELKEALNDEGDSSKYDICDDVMETESLKELKRIVLKSIEYYAEVYLRRSEFNKDMSFKNPKIEFKLNKEAYTKLFEYSYENDKKAYQLLKEDMSGNTRIADEMSSRHFKALRVAALSCFYDIERARVIDIEDIEYGISVAEKSGKSYEIIAKPSIIVDDVHNILNKTKKRFTVKQLEDSDIIPKGYSKQKLNSLWDRTREMAFQNNKILRSTMNDNTIIGEVWLEQLEETHNEIAHITYSTVESAQDIHMASTSIAFYDILKIPGVKKIGSGAFLRDSRSISNVSSLGNVLIYDVDDQGACSIRNILDRLRGVTALVYPTKSNNKDKHGIICERYRVVILCKQRLPYGENKKVAEEEFKELYKSVADHFLIKLDMSCCDLSRFFYVNDEAKTENVIRNGATSKPGEGTLLDLRYFMKNLKMSYDVKEASKVFESSKYWKSIGVKSILEKAISNSIITENRNNSLLIMSLSLKDYGLSFDKIKSYVIDVNSKMPNGELEDNELSNTVLSTLKKRMQNENIFPDGKNKGKEKKAEVINNIEEDDKTEFNELDNTSLVDLGIEI